MKTKIYSKAKSQTLFYFVFSNKRKRNMIDYVSVDVLVKYERWSIAMNSSKKQDDY